MIKEILKKAIALYDAGNEEEAMKMFQKVIAIDPSNKVAKEYMKMSGGGDSEDGMDEEPMDDETGMEDEGDMDMADEDAVNEVEDEVLALIEEKVTDIETIDSIIQKLEEYKTTLGE